MNEDVEIDTLVEKSLRSLFHFRCLEDCRLQTLSDINQMLKCVDKENRYQRDRRSKWKVFDFDKEDFFKRAQEKKFSWAPWKMGTEKKGQFDGIFLPSRGKRQNNRKYLLRLDQNPFSDAIELSDKDYFVPNRGKRQQNHIVGEVSKSGMKVIIPKSHTPLERDPWLFQNINSDDRSMIDLLEDLNQPGIEVNTDEN